MSNPSIILASNSPRRRELLSRAGVAFVSDPADVDESALPGEAPEDYAVRLALDKARATAKRHGDGLVIGADTIVLIGGRVMGKPASPDDAAGMLRALSGAAHEVITGMALVDAATGREITALERTEVRLRALSEAEIAAYVAAGEPMDKAGGYGIQGRASLFVTGITGCYFNVVGLPMAALAEMLGEMGVSLPELWRTGE